MNNKFYDIPENWYSEMNNDYIANNNSNIKLKEGFLKGNLFNNLYVPYKNYKYGELIPKNKKEELLYNLLKYNFGLRELNLYLDIYPNDTNYINLYNKYLEEENKLYSMYEKEYGPINLNYVNNSNKWEWISTKWPWEGIN